MKDERKHSNTDSGNLTTEDAAHAHSDLNLFSIIVSMLEGGHLYCNENAEAAAEIIKICLHQQLICLRIYDKARKV